MTNFYKGLGFFLYEASQKKSNDEKKIAAMHKALEDAAKRRTQAVRDAGGTPDEIAKTKPYEVEKSNEEEGEEGGEEKSNPTTTTPIFHTKPDPPKRSIFRYKRK